MNSPCSIETLFTARESDLIRPLLLFSSSPSSSPSSSFSPFQATEFKYLPRCQDWND